MIKLRNHQEKLTISQKFKKKIFKDRNKNSIKDEYQRVKKKFFFRSSSN